MFYTDLLYLLALKIVCIQLYFDKPFSHYYLVVAAFVSHVLSDLYSRTSEMCFGTGSMSDVASLLSLQASPFCSGAMDGSGQTQRRAGLQSIIGGAVRYIECECPTESNDITHHTCILRLTHIFYLFFKLKTWLGNINKQLKTCGQN